MANEGSPTPTYPQYTNRQLGDGLFDQLMGAVKYHLQQEYDQQRIDGDIWAKTYLGSLEAVLGNTTQYLLGILLLDEKTEAMKGDIELKREQARQLAYQTDNLLPAELAKLQAETALLGAQLTLTNAQTDKVNKEILFLDAKINSEKANVDETIADAGSLIGRQIDLLRIQGLGFAGDLEAKAAKLHADYDSVFQSVQENPADGSLALNAINQIIGILETVEKMKNSAYTDPVFTPPTVVVLP